MVHGLGILAVALVRPFQVRNACRRLRALLTAFPDEDGQHLPVRLDRGAVVALLSELIGLLLEFAERAGSGSASAVEIECLHVVRGLKGLKDG